MKQQGASNIGTQIQKGANFPSDGERQIAEFVQSNANNLNQIANTGYGMPQDLSPAVPVVPVPVPSVVPPPVTSILPQNGAGALQHSVLPPTPQHSVMPPLPQHSVLPAAPQVHDIGPMNHQHVPQATGNYFDPSSNGIVEDFGGHSYDDSMGSVDYGNLDSTFDCCGFIADARNYLIVDALYWERDDGVFRASNIPFIDDFDHSWGGRITYGRKRDSMRGFEASYMQLDTLLAVGQANDPGGSLVGGLVGNALTGDLPADAFTSFRNANFARQFHRTKLLSGELNRTWWGSDVAKAFIGARYIRFEDEFDLTTTNTSGEFGTHRLDVSNDLFGLQIGGEIQYDIGYRLSFSVGAKLGGYINSTDGDLVHVNNSAVRAFGSDSDTEFAWSGELGIWARYKLTPNVRLRAGYEGLGLFEVLEVESSFSSVVDSNSGNSFEDGTAIFHGPSVGIEFYR